MNSSRSWTRRMSTSDAGRKPRTPRSRIRPPLTTSITLPDHGLAGLRGGLDLLPGELEAGALLGEDQAPLGVLLRHHERVDLLADRDLVGRVHRAPDRELGDRDHALGLVADVDEHLVLVDAHDGAVDDLALVDRREGRLVVRDELPVGAESSRRLLRGADRSFRRCRWPSRNAEYSQVLLRTEPKPEPALRTWLRSSRRRRRRRRRAAGRAGRRRTSPRARAPGRRSPRSPAPRAGARRAPGARAARAAPPSRSRSWIRIIATLIMSAAVPCMTELTASRSPSERVCRFIARISGTGRRRPSSVVT